MKHLNAKVVDTMMEREMRKLEQLSANLKAGLMPPEIKPFDCYCGRHITRIPGYAKFSDCPELGGWYFDCECKTTIFVGPDSERIKKS